MYSLTEEQRMLRDMVRDLAQKVIAPRAAEVDETGEYPWDIKEALARQELLALPFPEEYGGAGADMLTLCLVVEQH